MSKHSYFGDILNISDNNENGNDTIEFTYNYELKYGSWEKEWVPFYNIGNGDYFCLISNECPNSSVYYYSHEENKIYK